MKRTKREKKGRLLNAVLILMILSGLSLLLYPGVSNYLHQSRSSAAIYAYAESVSSLNTEDYERLWSEAGEYNRSLLHRGNPYLTGEEEDGRYERMLSVNGSPVMGYIEIEKLGVSLPIFHGTEESVLQMAAGHIEWSSLPVGGEGSHCVLSAHRGLPSARLFTDLDKIKQGDTFTLSVLDKTLHYEVDQILVVLPEETGELTIRPGEDYCTLLTCTPYGINTHRLLVRGRRVESAASSAPRLVSEALRVQTVLTVSVAALPLLLVLLLGALCGKPRKKNVRNG